MRKHYEKHTHTHTEKREKKNNSGKHNNNIERISSQPNQDNYHNSTSCIRATVASRPNKINKTNQSTSQ